MLLQNLENIAQQLEGRKRQLVQQDELHLDLTALHQQMQRILTMMFEQQHRLTASLQARNSLQAAYALEERAVPQDAQRMYLLDQLEFYEKMIDDLFAFLTGSDQGRCVSFALSVEELLFFVRLLREEKVMDAGALKPIFIFLARHARTIGSDELSYESLRKKYSKIRTTAKQRIGRLLSLLVARANQEIAQDSP